MWWFCLVGTLTLALSNPVHADERSTENNNQVMQAFTPKDDGDSGVIVVENKTKNIVMFVMGVPLLIFLAITGALGIRWFDRIDFVSDITDVLPRRNRPCSNDASQ